MSTNKSARKILDRLIAMKEAGALSSIEQLIMFDAQEIAETVDAAEALMDDPSLSSDQYARLKEIVEMLEQWLARTEKGLRARSAKGMRMMFATPVTK